MWKVVLYITLIVMAGYVVPYASAQGAPGGKSVCPLPPCTAPQPRGIDIADAKKLVAVAVTEAAKAGWNVAFAIVDANGDLVYFERMDGAHTRAVTSALGKARAALLFGVSGRELADATAAGKPVTATITTPAAWAWEINFGPGGLPLVKDGKVVAAIGVGGARPNDAEKQAGKFPDEEYAKAGIAAIASSGYSTR